MGAPVDHARQPGVGQHGDGHRAVLGQVAQVLLHLRRSGGAVDAEHVRLHGQQRRHRRADLGTDQHPARGLDGHLHLHGDGSPLGLHGPAAGGHGGLGLQQVHAGLDDEQVDAALQQTARLLFVGVPESDEADVTDGRQLRPGPDRAGHVAWPPVAGPAGRDLLGDAGRRHVQRVGPIGDAVLLQHGAERAEAGRLDHVHAHREEVVVHGGDDVRPGQAQHLVAALELRAAEVVRREVEPLDEGAEGAVEHDQAVVDRIEVVLDRHPVNATGARRDRTR